MVPHTYWERPGSILAEHHTAARRYPFLARPTGSPRTVPADVGGACFATVAPYRELFRNAEVWRAGFEV